MPRGASAVGVAGAYATGLADAALTVAGRAVRSAVDGGRKPAYVAAGTVRAFLRQPPVARAAAPVRRLGGALADSAETTVARGRSIATDARAGAVAFLRVESANGLAWLREEVLPPMIDDLVGDPKVRELVLEQAHGVLTDAAREVRQRSASADDRVEAGFRRLFGAGRHELAP